MKKIRFIVLLAGVTAASGLLLAQVPEGAPAPAAPQPATNTASGPEQVTASSPAANPTAPALTPAADPGIATTNLAATAEVTNAPALTTGSVQGASVGVTNSNPDELRLNFRNAPLEMVLNYLSEAAGFTIVLETHPTGRIDAWSNQTLTRDEAVDLLNSVLNRNGYAAIRKGRTLTIINRDEAKTRALPVKSGSDPEQIPDNDEMVTQIIPVRYVEAAQLLKDLQPLVSVQTAMTANESGNSIVITDTQANIRRVAEVIKAIDMGAEDFTVVRVFRLQYADPNEMADLLTNLFPDDSRSGSQSPFQMGRFGGRGGPGGFPGFGGNTGSSGAQSQRVKKRARVLAVADARTSSVVVTAASDLMTQIEGVVQELDANPARKQNVRVFQLQNADPSEAMQVLQDIFQKSGTYNNRNNQNQNSALQNRSLQQQNQYSTGNRSINRTGNSSSRTGRTFGN